MGVGKQNQVDEAQEDGAAASYRRLSKNSLAAKALGHDDGMVVRRRKVVAAPVIAEPVKPPVEDTARIAVMMEHVANLRKQWPWTQIISRGNSMPITRSIVGVRANTQVHRASDPLIVRTIN